MTKTRNRAPRRIQTTGSSPPWGKFLLVGGAGLALVLLVAVIVQDVLDEPVRGIPEGTQQVALGPPIHMDEIIYEPHEVPAGGPHSPIWANCGFYSEPILAEHAVHSLEHAAVWITYRPDLPPADIDRLRRLARPGAKVLASPVEGQEPPLMATAWGYQLTLNGVEDPRLEQFVGEFAGSLSHAPEPGGACTGGVGSPD